VPDARSAARCAKAESDWTPRLNFWIEAAGPALPSRADPRAGGACPGAVLFRGESRAIASTGDLELLGEPLQRAADLGDELVAVDEPVARPSRQELEVVDDDQLQPAGEAPAPAQHFEAQVGHRQRRALAYDQRRRVCGPAGCLYGDPLEFAIGGFVRLRQPASRRTPRVPAGTTVVRDKLVLTFRTS
jgi:hypothetical protein